MFAIPSALFAHFLPPVQTCNQIEELLKTSQEYYLDCVCGHICVLCSKHVLNTPKGEARCRQRREKCLFGSLF